jgi:hypothetical protein
MIRAININNSLNTHNYDDIGSFFPAASLFALLFLALPGAGPPVLELNIHLGVEVCVATHL